MDQCAGVDHQCASVDQYAGVDQQHASVDQYTGVDHPDAGVDHVRLPGLFDVAVHRRGLGGRQLFPQ
jgi:hypothetical protein